MRLNHFFVGNHIFTSCLCLFFSFHPFFGNNFVPLFCPRWIKAGREPQRRSYHYLQQLVGAQRKVVKTECRTFINFRCSKSDRSALWFQYIRWTHTKNNIPKRGKPSAEITCKIANCENLELFPEIKPISREIICFHLRRHAIQFEVARAHYISFQFPTDPAEPNIHKRSGLGHLSIEIRDISYWASDWNGRLARLYHDIHSNPPRTSAASSLFPPVNTRAKFYRGTQTSHRAQCYDQLMVTDLLDVEHHFHLHEHQRWVDPAVRGVLELFALSLPYCSLTFSTINRIRINHIRFGLQLWQNRWGFIWGATSGQTEICILTCGNWTYTYKAWFLM